METVFVELVFQSILLSKWGIFIIYSIDCDIFWFSYVLKTVYYGLVVLIILIYHFKTSSIFRFKEGNASEFKEEKI